MTCRDCAHFQMQDDTSVRVINGKAVTAYFWACRVLPSRLDADRPSCPGFADRAEAEAREAAAAARRLGYDKPLPPTANLTQTDLLNPLPAQRVLATGAAAGRT